MLTKIWQALLTFLLEWLAKFAKSAYEQIKRNKEAQETTEENAKKLEDVLAKDGATDEEIKDASEDLLNGNRR